MSDAVDRGITVTEMAPMGQPIDVSPETTAAFVGRALRGPLNKPTLLHSFGDFRRRFGDVWTRSSLAPAAREFFEHGGRNLLVVRVANDARGAMLCIPASGSALVLRALEPGSTERIRAAVDLDGIDPSNDELFNLTLQRIDPDKSLVVDQEFFPRLNWCEGRENFVADRLLASSLVRVELPFPAHRPEMTAGAGVSLNSAYAEHVQQGSDGHELTDYDLIGSRPQCTGIFALQQIDRFDLLYLPPPGKARDPGPAALLAAEMYCRQRGAMLIMDPPRDWVTPVKAIGGIRDLGLASPNMLSYFPRMYHRDVDEGAPRAVGGALAGLLCKLDRHVGPWHGLDRHGMGFNRMLIAAFDVDDEDTRALAREGLNVISKGPAGRARLRGSVTLGRGSETQRQFASLPVRRLCLWMINSIAAATRWAVFEPDNEQLAQRIRAQVDAYLSALADFGAFENDRFVVECDAGVSHRADLPEHGVTILVIFQPRGSREPVSFTLHQTVSGFRIASTAFAPVMENCA